MTMNPLYVLKEQATATTSNYYPLSLSFWKLSLFLFLLLFVNVSQAQDCIVFEPLPDRVIECSESLIFEEPTATNTCCETLIYFIFEDEIVEEDCQRTITRTWFAASDCGGGSISQTITVIDNSPPVITIDDPLVAGLNSGDTIVFNCDELDLINPNSITIVARGKKIPLPGSNCVFIHM